MNDSMLIQDVVFDELAEVFAAEGWTAEQLAARLVVSLMMQLGELALFYELPIAVKTSIEAAKLVVVDAHDRPELWGKCGIDKVRLLYAEGDDPIASAIAKAMLPTMLIASLHNEHWGELDVVRSTIELARNASRLHANTAALTAMEADES